MTLHLTELQQITLRDVLVTAGLTARQVEDIFLLLSFKRERVQKAFYYRAQGMTFEEVGEQVGVPERTAHHLVIDQCREVQEYLRKPSDSVPTYIDG